MDFTKAFDKVRHQTLMEKNGLLDLPDHIFNWLANYFNQRGHLTKLHDIVSSLAIARGRGESMITGNLHLSMLLMP